MQTLIAISLSRTGVFWQHKFQLLEVSDDKHHLDGQHIKLRENLNIEKNKPKTEEFTHFCPMFLLILSLFVAISKMKLPCLVFISKCLLLVSPTVFIQLMLLQYFVS